MTRLRNIIAAGFIAVYFLAFTWPGPLLYFSGDDMMNLHNYWTTPLSTLIKANLCFWSPYYRPFGALVYLPLYSTFGFNPRPLYILYYVVLLLNLYLVYLVVSRIARSAQIGAIATLLWAFHGKLDYLYFSAGTLYDVFCLTWFFTALSIYLQVRNRGEFIRGWRLAIFLGSFVCCLNSKEMGATLPVILLLYELFLHPPQSRRPAALWRWMTHEGRAVLITGLFVLVYIPGKFSAGGFTNVDAYRPVFTMARYLENVETYWAELFYRNGPYNSVTPLGIIPLTAADLGWIYGALIAVVLLVRSRWMTFGLLFFQITLLPVSFTPPRLGFVLYLPLVGLALFVAALVIQAKDKLLAILRPRFRIGDPAAMTLAFVVTAGALLWIHGSLQGPRPPINSRNRMVARQLRKKHPKMPHGARLLFIESPLPDTYDLVFLTDLLYRDHTFFITQLNGPEGQRIPVDRLERYDYVLSYEDGALVEYAPTDLQRILRLHALKEQARPGERFKIGNPDQKLYIVKDVMLGEPKAESAWTLDNPELQFNLSSAEHRVLVVEFVVVGAALKKTGPLRIEFLVNNRSLGHETYADEGVRVFRQAVPEGWLSTAEPSVLRIHVENPYVAPQDGARLGFLLISAGFEAEPTRSATPSTGPHRPRAAPARSKTAKPPPAESK